MGLVLVHFQNHWQLVDNTNKITAITIVEKILSAISIKKGLVLCCLHYKADVLELYHNKRPILFVRSNKTLIEIEIMMKDSKQIDLMDMNVTWFPKDLEVYDDQVGVVEATILTIVKIITLGMAVIAQRTFYRMMKRLPGRVINHILYPHMVCLIYYLSIISLFTIVAVLIHSFFKLLIMHFQ